MTDSSKEDTDSAEAHSDRKRKDTSLHIISKSLPEGLRGIYEGSASNVAILGANQPPQRGTTSCIG